MGYYYEIIYSDFNLPKKKFKCAFHRIKNKLLENKHYKNSVTQDDPQTLEELLENWGWAGVIGTDGEMYDLYHLDGDKKYREYDTEIIQGLSKYVTTDSQIQCRGEDGAIWRWYFKDQNVIEQQGKIVFDDPE